MPALGTKFAIARVGSSIPVVIETKCGVRISLGIVRRNAREGGGRELIGIDIFSDIFAVAELGGAQVGFGPALLADLHGLVGVSVGIDHGTAGGGIGFGLRRRFRFNRKFTAVFDTSHTRADTSEISHTDNLIAVINHLVHGKPGDTARCINGPQAALRGHTLETSDITVAHTRSVPREARFVGATIDPSDIVAQFISRVVGPHIFEQRRRGQTPAFGTDILHGGRLIVESSMSSHISSLVRKLLTLVGIYP